MPNIQVPPERRRIILEAHRAWSNTLPRAPGQIGGAITTLVEGPPIYDPGEVMPYSDFEYVRFLGVPQAFVDYLVAQGIGFRLN
jgi:hypothetical protein